MRRAATVVALFGCAVVAPVAAAQDGSRQSASLRFTTKKPGSPSGVVFEVEYRNPVDPAAKPPAVAHVVTTLARGARIDTSVPDLCTASDAELMLRGGGACSQASQVGVGSVTVDTGVAGPARFVDADIDFRNNANELIFVNTERQTGARTVLRSPVTRRSVSSDVPALPGTPPDGGALKRVHFTDFPIAEGSGAARRAYTTTPRRCPRSGRWINRVTFTYRDGVTQRVRSPSRCSRRATRRPRFTG